MKPSPTPHCAHTPGPWRYDNDALLPDEWYMDGPVTAGGRFIAAAITSPETEGPGLPEAKANARLIAAAPDLLAALEGLLAITNSYAPEAKVAQIAIAKTRSEPQWP